MTHKNWNIYIVHKFSFNSFCQEIHNHGFIENIHDNYDKHLIKTSLFLELDLPLRALTLICYKIALTIMEKQKFCVSWEIQDELCNIFQNIELGALTISKRKQVILNFHSFQSIFLEYC